MGKKIKSEMDAQRKLFQDGAAKNGVDAPTAELIFDKMAKFAGYGFNKGHAAPYALIAYQTAYLKANHPVELMAASMTLDLGNTDKLNVFRQELQRMGVKLLPPDINRSQVEFSVENMAEGAAIRYALAAVKGVGAQAMSEIVAERTRKGAFKDLFDFAERLDSKQFNKRQFENLAKAGAFDGLNPNRAQSFAAAEVIMRQAAAAVEERSTSQMGFFGGASGITLKKPPLPPVTEWPSMDRLQQEFEAIGFYLSAHPLDPYETALKRLGVVPSGKLVAHLQSGKPGRVRLAGIVGARKERTSAKGNRFAFVGMSDLTGMFEVMLFSEILAQARPLLDSGQPLLITCDAKLEEDNVRLNGQSIDTLDNAAAASSAGLRVVLQDPKAIDAMKAVFLRDVGIGKTGRVRLIVPADRREVEVILPGLFPIGGQTRASVKAIPGVADVSDF